MTTARAPDCGYQKTSRETSILLMYSVITVITHADSTSALLSID